MNNTNTSFDQMMQRENPGSFSEEMVNYLREQHNEQSEE
jgi:hypothetical protein